jgi:uncharacterized protein
MSSLPWYHKGLKFECLGCGECCTGEPGYVWVSDEEIVAMADALAVDAGELEKAVIRKVGEGKSLAEMPNGDCIFFDSGTRRCQIYSVRPIQCRTWPFWESNLESPQTWREVCQRCPGSGKGPTVANAEIEARVSQRRL